VATDAFEVDLLDAGVEDEDIISLQRIEARLVLKINEMPTTSNVRTRAQAAILMVKPHRPKIQVKREQSIKPCSSRSKENNCC
jgi:hypothetical protein